MAPRRSIQLEGLEKNILNRDKEKKKHGEPIEVTQNLLYSSPNSVFVGFFLQLIVSVCKP
jgi:hypothetical protein